MAREDQYLSLGDPVAPLDPVTERLASALTTLLRRDAELAEARRNVPDYNPHYDAKDYCAQQIHDYNQAAESVEEAIVAVMRKNGHEKTRNPN